MSVGSTQKIHLKFHAAFAQVQKELGCAHIGSFSSASAINHSFNSITLSFHSHSIISLQLLVSCSNVYCHHASSLHHPSFRTGPPGRSSIWHRRTDRCRSSRLGETICCKPTACARGHIFYSPMHRAALSEVRPR